MRFLVTLAVLALFVQQSLIAAQREVIRSDWNGLRQQVAARKLNGRSARVSLTGGGRVKTRVLEVSDTALVVPRSRSTKAWASGGDTAQIPREQVAGVRFEGRTGHGGLIGGMAGLGAGAAAGYGIGTSTDCSEGACIIMLPAIGLAVTIGGAVIGYFVGRAASQHAPEFILQP